MQKTNDEKYEFGHLKNDLKNSVCQLWWGCSYYNISKWIILDPTGLVFKTYYDSNQFISSSKGWHWCGRLKRGQSVWDIITCSPASLIIDACLAISHPSRHIFLVGLAGGIGNVNIYDIVYAESAHLHGNSTKVFPKSDKSLGIDHHRGKVVSFPAMLLENLKEIEKLKCQKVSAVDLETYHFYKYGRSISEEIGAYFLISDLPNLRPFYFRPYSFDTLQNRIVELLENIFILQR
jgi:hypothetical protein